MTKTVLLFLALEFGICFSLRANVSHVTLTVSNLAKSMEFYQQVLGGSFIRELSALEPSSGDELHEMYTDMLNPKDQASLREGGTHKVCWAFMLFDNIMIQLIQFVSTSPDFKNESRNHCKDMFMMLSNPTIAFWVRDSVNFTQYALVLEQKSIAIGFPQVKFMQPLLQSQSAESRPASQSCDDLRKGPLQGISIGYAQGPDGERLKFIQLDGSSRSSFGKHYCMAETKSPALLNKNLVDKNRYKTPDLSSQLFGVNHITIPTSDLNAAQEFFTTKLNGYFIHDIQPTDLQSPSLNKLYKMISSCSAKKPVDETGNIKESKLEKSKEDKILLNLRYILLGNIMLELQKVSSTSSINQNKDIIRSYVTDPGHIIVQLGSDNLQNFHDIISNILPEPAMCDCSPWMPSCLLCHMKALFSKTYASFIKCIKTGPLQGLQYYNNRGPSQEKLGIVYFDGQALEKLQDAMNQFRIAIPLSGTCDGFCFQDYSDFCSTYKQDDDIL